MKKNCKTCGSEFTLTRSDKQYCSGSCRRKKYREKIKANKKPIIKKCLWCKKDFKILSNMTKKRSCCKGECTKKFKLHDNKIRARKRVRERLAKLPPKYCETCGVELELSTYNFNKIRFCKPCRVKHHKIYKDEYLKENRERIRKEQREKHAERMKCPKYREKRRLQSLKEREKNKPTYTCLVCKKQFQNKFNRNRYKTCSDECGKIYELTKQSTTVYRIRSRLTRALRKNVKNISENWPTELEFTSEDLMNHFESLFTEKMNWYEFNKGNIHIDHIRPVASFNQKQLEDTTSEDFKKCWALENLQPLWASDNCSKGSLWKGKRWSVKT
tara:strand:+ start:40 stop:1026 length:987 start_codon:yes stop_codon:yes gene_type:complete